MKLFRKKKQEPIFHDTEYYYYFKRAPLIGDPVIQCSKRMKVSSYCPGIGIDNGILLCDIILN
jgi:hypothetical protein